ncbi:Rne/Rng family ribonuclease [Tindallia californiensis]|uniref:RNAse G n=1 Tax=Tindallia californiensis TaxID=159292 RepID=A0A1H3NC59_9FIRM|nr:Rne/Rng family ribonuclease [Tindallia californiensis]SDY86497.1 RNAse G [Tindallia californiensis]
MNQIVADVGALETRIAVLENEIVKELHFERKNHTSIVNNIYCGTIINIVKGIGTVFVDIGVEKNVFLHETEVNKPITRLNKGDKLLIQIKKDAISEKGAKATTFLSLPGKYVIFLPEEKQIGISSRITNQKDRADLEAMGKEIIEGTSHGIVMRTEALYQSISKIRQEYQNLSTIWNSITLEKANKGDLLFQEDALLDRLIRDVMNKNTKEFVINDSLEAKRLRAICWEQNPDDCIKIIECDPDENLFERYNIENQWKQAMQNKVSLESGGSIVINTTEALTVIDVNTGKNIGSDKFEDTVLETNLEAAVEISRQLRLRDIGGIIVIDFIDMKKKHHHYRLLALLRNELKKDRQKTVVAGMTKLGLVEMTRKKTREKVDQMFMEICDSCNGTGDVPSVYQDMYTLEKKLRLLVKHKDIEQIKVSIHPKTWQKIQKEGLNLKVMTDKYNHKATFIQDSMLPPSGFKVELYKQKSKRR